MVEDTRNMAVDIMETIVVAAVAAFPMYSGASVVLNGAVEIVKIAMLCAMQLEIPTKEVKWYNDKSEEVEVNLKGEARLAFFVVEIKRGLRAKRGSFQNQYNYSSRKTLSRSYQLFPHCQGGLLLKGVYI